MSVRSEVGIGARRVPRRWRVVVLALAVALVGLGLTACFPPPDGTPTSVTTDPPLFPAFQTGITNYVVRCDPSTPVEVHVTAPTSTLVSVDSSFPRGGVFGVNVQQSAGQRFTIAVTTDPANDTTTLYNVRCLPSDFPPWTAQPASYGAAPFFMTAPLVAFAPTRTAIYDRNGVPLWWSDPQFTVFSTLLPNGNVGTLLDGGVEERKLDGTFVRSVKPVGAAADGHDMLLLPNGHFVMVTSQAKAGVDLTAIGGPSSASICNHVIQEVDPANGAVVWSWDTSDHIPVTEMDPQWFASNIATGPTILGCGYDVYHWNAIEPTSTGFLLSFRHLDAIYAIDQATGNIAWKLGGTARPERLTVVGDPVFTGGSHFGGQHDGRVLADGTVTLFDDGSNLGRGPRAVRYVIDTNARTATLLEAVDDPQIPASPCCGSAREVAPGVWVVGWGGTETGTESVGGIRQFTLSFPGALVYRTVPLTSSQVSVAQLVTAMDHRFANPTASAESAGSPESVPYPP